jgi:hypothetical protein
MKKFLITATVMAIIFLFVYASAERKLIEARQQIGQLQQELAHATLPMERDTIRDSVEVVTQAVAEVGRQKLKRALDRERQLVKDLRLKVAQLEAVQTLAISTADTVRATYGRPESISGRSDSLFHYSDQWTDLSFNVKDTTFYYNIRDSLSTVVYREYRHRFLWWRWGTKGYRVKIANFNPHARVIYNRYIKSK